MARAGGKRNGFYVKPMMHLGEMQRCGEVFGNVADAEGRLGGHDSESKEVILLV